MSTVQVEVIKGGLRKLPDLGKRFDQMAVTWKFTPAKTTYDKMFDSIAGAYSDRLKNWEVIRKIVCRKQASRHAYAILVFEISHKKMDELGEELYKNLGMVSGPTISLK